MADPAAENKPADPGAPPAPKAPPRKKKTVEEMNEYFYNITTMHKIFFVSCLFLLVSFIVMIWQDYDREWKDYQRRFLKLELEKVKHDLGESKRRMDEEEKKWRAAGGATLEKLQQELETLNQNLRTSSHRFEFDGQAVEWSHERIEAEIKKLQGAYELKQQEKNFRKSDYDHLRSFYEIAKEHYEEAKRTHNAAMEHVYDGDMKKYKKLMEDMDARLRRATAEFDHVEARKTVLEQARAAIGKNRDEVQKEVKKLTREKEALELRLKKEGPSLTNALRDAPMLDFAAPTLKIEQVVIDDIHDELHFTTVPKVDRCHTCHKGIMNPAYETDEKTGGFKDRVLREFIEKEYPNEKDRRKYTRVFKAHPRLDLYLSSSSKHPIEKFGCTVCHQGDGTATDFAWAVHTPTSKEQEEDWKYRNGYSHRELWEHPMNPRPYIYSSCRKCHSGEVEIKTPHGEDVARPFNTGRLMFERLGCYGCHKTEGYSILTKDLPELEPGKPDETARTRRPGPPLTHMKDKVTADWAYKWLMDPKGFRASTRMPKFFDQTNSRGKEYDETMATAIVKYLTGLSDSRGTKDPPGKGDPKRGEQIVQTFGCRACHTVSGGPVADAAGGRSRILAEFGPDLSTVGSKMNRAWLFEWVREPKHYWTDTRMPDLRMSDQEALDVTDYLMTQRSVDFEKKPGIPAVSDKTVDALIVEQFKGKPEAEVRQILAEMSKQPERKLHWLGERMVRNFGCYGCHQVEDRNKWRVVPAEVDRALEQINPQKTTVFPERHTSWAFLRDRNELVKAVQKLEGLDEIIVARLKERLTDREARARVKAMSAADKETWVRMNVKIDASGDWPNQEGIGVELSGPQAIGSKAVDRFDFGYKLHREHGLPEGYEVAKSPGAKALIPPTRHDWIFNKLKNPRLYDDGKLDSKPPDELLKMPNFQLTDDEATHVVNFLLSLTTEHMKKEVVRTMTPEGQGLQRGERLLRNFNCRACHRLSEDRFLLEAEIENPRTLMKEKKRFWVEGEATPYGDFVKLQEGNLFVDWIVNRHSLKPGPEPFPLPLEGETDVTLPDGSRITRAAVLRHLPPEGGEIFEHIYFHKALQQPDLKDLVEKLKDPNVSVSDKRDYFQKLDEKFRKKLPPLLVTQGHKVQGEWFFNFLKNPYDIRPSLRRSDEGMNLRMPTFGMTDEQANALVRYFAVRDRTGYPYEHMAERDEAWLKRREPEILKLLDETLDASKQKKGLFVKVCLECHVVGGVLPKDPDKVTEIGPDLARVPQRLRSNWLKAWLDQPLKIYPGTNMPPIPEGPGREENLQSLTDLLMNFDRFHKKAVPVSEEKKDEKPKDPKPPEKPPSKDGKKR